MSLRTNAWGKHDQSDWECELFGTGQSLVFIPSRGNEPNWFWRWTQRIILGNTWKKRANASSPPE